MKYYIYESYTNNKATVHRAECTDCNHGTGKNKDKDNETNTLGRWHGFNSFREAMRAAAKTMPKKEMRCCRKCYPDSD